MSDDRFLRVLNDSTVPVFSTREMARAVGFSSNKGAYNRLIELQYQGLVTSKMVGQSRAWWLTDAGRGQLADSE